jgi:hypothetical protein
MENTTPKSGPLGIPSDRAKTIISSAVEGVVPLPGKENVPAASTPTASSAAVRGAEVGEVIEIPSGKLGEKEAVDGEVRPVAEVSEEEGRAMSLSPKQCVAIVKLTSGETKSKTAKAAGVDRSTLNRWIRHDPAFAAAFNGWQEDVLSTAQGQMVATTKDAMEMVIKAIRGGDAKLAWKLLESLGLTGRVTPGPTDVEELKRLEELERRKRELEEKKERKKLEDDELMNGAW